jgi:DNA polymerase
LGTKAEDVPRKVKEQLEFFSQIGVEYITRESPLKPLEEKILHCQSCSLAGSRTKAVPGEGSFRAQLMFVGEAPGRDEDIQGRPFVGRAGQLLTKIIAAMKFIREDVYITNIIKCRPPENRNPNKDEIQNCQGYLLKQIELIQPRVIVSLGKVATDFFIPNAGSMRSLRSNFHMYNEIRIMPTFHPSYLVRNEGNRELKKMVWEDMKKVMSFLGKK